MIGRPPLRLRLLQRLWLTAWLVLGLSLQPLLAATCDVGDARQALMALSDGGDVATSAGQADAADAPSTAPDDCCANPTCGDCCLTATASLPAHAFVLAAPVTSRLVAHAGAAIAPRHAPVDNPPPIRG